jgi:hypothetical protein
MVFGLTRSAQRVGVAVRGGKVTLPLYVWEKFLGSGSDLMNGYTGTATREVKLTIRDKSDIPAQDLNTLNELTRVDITHSVHFENGVATVTWNEMVGG